MKRPRLSFSAKSDVPKPSCQRNFDQIAPAPAEDVEGALVGIAFQRLLHLQPSPSISLLISMQPLKTHTRIPAAVGSTQRPQHSVYPDGPSHLGRLSESAGAQVILGAIRKRWPWVKHLFADSSYDRLKIMCNTAYVLFVIEIIRRSDAQRSFELLPRRWVVEHASGWMTRWRRLVRDYEDPPTVPEP